MAEVGRRRYQKSAKRRSDAINFLANISLDGSFSQPEDSPVKAEDKNESRGEKGTARIVAEQQEKQTSDSTLYVPKVRDTTETDASTSEIMLKPRATESFSPGEARGRTRSAAKAVIGASYGGLRVKSFSSDKGSPLLPSKFDPGSRPRVLLVSARKVPFSLYSVLPYSRRSQHGLLRNDSDTIASGRTRKSSGTRGVGSDTMSGLTGIELGDGGKEISYRHLLVPTKDQIAYRRQLNLELLGSPHSPAVRKIPGHPLSIQWDRGDSDNSLLEHTTNVLPYDPMELDDPGLHAGKHSKVMTFTSYMVSILDYTKPSELKKDINQKFKDKFPHIDLSLSKLRSIKREMKKIAVDAGTMEMLTLAHAYVYYEKLVLYGKINKENRKLCAGACLTLAAKLSDTKGADLQNLIKEIEDTFRENRKEFLQLEFPILVALEFSLHLPESVVLPHYRRIAQLT
ncbi:CDK5 and ABL1 enzyme substrate 1-like isoform X3 [Patiria miniata]|uniref:Cyclin N-terminal domain-containing protein n=1 Tax=Patiria miniata TaxID=46514 RepID=A0A913ZZ80_PATMI|nr:CDK5 and ABL1 enzyme substrate 1-like isoform X3 [Patiria miniata]